MTLPKNVAELQGENVVLELECIDRMYLNLYVPQLASAPGVAAYFRGCKGHRLASTKEAVAMSEGFRRQVLEFAERKATPIIRFEKGMRKDDVMHKRLRKFKAREGVVFIGIAQEKARVPRTIRKGFGEGEGTIPWIDYTTAMVKSRAKRGASSLRISTHHGADAAEGFEVNGKRVARIRREEGIKVSKKQRRMKRLGISTAERQRAERPGQVWSWDFVADQTENGSSFRILTLLDEHTRQCLAIHPAWSIRAVDVITVVEAAIARYGAPGHLRSDNGPEFIASCMQDWLKAQGIKTLYIRPGSPWENGHIESFHDKLRDECLNRELFGTLHEARVILESWRVEYNDRRPHSALGYRTPNEYAGRRTNRFDGGCAPPNPAPLAAAGVRGELSNATRWQTNENQDTNEPAELQL